MASGTILSSSSLVLRILSLLALLACGLAFVINSVSVKLVINHLTLHADAIKLTYKDVNSYRYAFYTAVIAAAYTLLQLPFAIYHVCTGKRMIRNGWLPEIDFYGDQAISFLLATGVSVGFAYSFEYKSVIDDLFKAIADPAVPEIQESEDNYDRFLNAGIIATVLLLLGFICMAVISVLSSINGTRSRG